MNSNQLSFTKKEMLEKLNELVNQQDSSSVRSKRHIGFIRLANPTEPYIPEPYPIEVPYPIESDTLEPYPIEVPHPIESDTLEPYPIEVPHPVEPYIPEPYPIELPLSNKQNKVVQNQRVQVRSA